MIIQHNLQAMNANRMLGGIVTAQSKSTEKLSSGYRINRAGDDAAGLAISEKMRGQIRGLNQASTNAQDGISLIQTAEGALNEAQAILQRMRELSVQAANETNTESDRENIQLEMNELTSEINRIGNTTEFNTKKLLMGSTKEAVSQEGAIETLAEAEEGVTSATISAFTTLSESKLPSASSTATVYSGKSTSTAVAKATAQTTAAEKAVGESANLFGITFTAKTPTESYNGKLVQVALSGSSGTDASSVAESTGDINISISKADYENLRADGKVTVSELEALITRNAGSLSTHTITSSDNGASEQDITNALDSALGYNAAADDKWSGVVTATAAQATFAGANAAVAGVYDVELTTAFSEHGDTITIAGKTYTAVIEQNGKTADASKGEFKIGSVNASTGAVTIDALADQATKLKDALVASGDFTGTASAGKISLTEATGKEGKTGMADEVGNKPTIKGAGGDNYITISDELGQNFGIEVVSGSALKVDYDETKDLLTITLDATKPENNTAEKIQEKIREYTATNKVKETNNGPDATDTLQRDFSKVVVTAGGSWDKEAGITQTVFTATSGGIQATLGKYSFEVTNTSEGDVVKIGEHTFTAKKSGANAARNEFIAGDVDSLISAINNGSTKDVYKATATGNTITLVEKTASGVNLKEKDLSVAATGTVGEFEVGALELMEDGASVTIDGEVITVSSKNAHSGYADGTAIKQAATTEEQTSALVNAINTNKVLSQKYTASVGETGNVVLTQKIASNDAPTVSTATSTKGNFELKLQIGANTGQSMTVEIGDTRSLALGISGDGSNKTVTASDGSVATYTEVETVSNGSDNNNIEFALDVSTFDHASAATAVIDDALVSLSEQRAVLGAAQNRLEHTIANLDTSAENLQAAESRIRDVDMAKEMVTYSKNTILQQAAQSMLAQANQSTQGVLSLLQ